MNRSFIYVSLMAALTALAISCGSTSVNVNTSNMTNRASNIVGNAANTVANAANTASNAISNTTRSMTAMSDPDFVNEAAIGGMAEVELGKMASTKAVNAEVKRFGQLMVIDHSKANEELKALAAKKGWKLPTELDSSRRSTADGLRNRVGADFDAQYVDAMVEDHGKVVAAFEDKAKNAADPDLKAFAEKTLPTLRKHLDAIKAIQAKMP